MALRPKIVASVFGITLLRVIVILAASVIAAIIPAAQAQTFQVIHNFTAEGEDGATPTAGVTMDGAENIYGTTEFGGAFYGTVYKLKRSGSNWLSNPLYVFLNGGDGANPMARVIFGPDGALYGTASGGGNSYGTVFKLRPPPSACKTALCPWELTALYAFGGGADGLSPGLGDLLFEDGAIYGTTIFGGSGGDGLLYQLMPSGVGWTESVVHNFGGVNDGAKPYAGVIADSAGNLYGTTADGGPSDSGNAFQLLSSMEWTENVLHTFTDQSDGRAPVAGLIFDQMANLYGATIDGGDGGGGTIFELLHSDGGWTHSVLYSFTGRPGGCGPWGTLVMDQAGSLYGTTMCDGAHDEGNVFKLTKTDSGWTYTSLYDFTGGSDGGNPISNVILDTAGNLYGTASTGGTGTCDNGCGVVWEITP